MLRALRVGGCVCDSCLCYLLFVACVLRFVVVFVVVCVGILVVADSYFLRPLRACLFV